MLSEVTWTSEIKLAISSIHDQTSWCLKRNDRFMGPFLFQPTDANGMIPVDSLEVLRPASGTHPINF